MAIGGAGANTTYRTTKHLREKTPATTRAVLARRAELELYLDVFSLFCPTSRETSVAQHRAETSHPWIRCDRGWPRVLESPNSHFCRGLRSLGGSATTTVKVIQHRPTSSQGAGYPIDGTVHSGPIPALLGSCPSVLIQKAQCRELESCASPYAARSYAFRSYHSARRSPPDRCCQSAGRIDALLGGLVLGAQRTGGDAGPQWPVRRAAPCGSAEMQGPPLLLVRTCWCRD